MAIWLIRPIDENGPDWKPWYDKCFGFVVSADTEQQARIIASRSGETGDEGPDIWSDSLKTETFCLARESDYENGVVMVDFHAA